MVTRTTPSPSANSSSFAPVRRMAPQVMSAVSNFSGVANFTSSRTSSEGDGPAAVCGTPGCPGGPAETVTVTTLAVLFEQHRATRRFIHDPGLVEARIFDALAARKYLAGRVRVTPYPALDTLDILIEFVSVNSGGEVALETWGADAKDQDSARLLGWSFTWPAALPCDRRLLVLPEHRCAQPGYVSDLTTELDGRVRGVEVVGERRLVSMVVARARELAR